MSSVRGRVVLLGCVLAMGLVERAASRARSQVPTAAPAGQRSSAAGTAKSQLVLKSARQFAQAQQYRAAEHLVLEHLRDSQAPKEHDAAFRQLATELGTIYFWSGQYEQAANWLGRCAGELELIKRPSRAMLEEQAAVAALLADTDASLGRNEQAAATLRRVIARYGDTGSADPAIQIELAGHLATLGESRLSDDKTSPLLEVEIDRLAGLLKAGYQRGAVARGRYARGLKSLAAFEQHAGQYDRAVATWKSLLHADESKQDAREDLAAWKQIADIYRSAGNAAAEVDALRTATLLNQRQRETRPAKRGDSDVRPLFDQAELDRMLGEALVRAGDREEAAHQLAEARQKYRAALSGARQAEPSPTEGEDVSRILILERLADVSGDLLELPGTADARPVQDAIAAHNELLVEYLRTLLPSDPRIAQLRVSLGSFYINTGDFTSARNELVRAEQYWSARRPANHSMLARTLNLLGETILATGDRPLREAQEYFNRAGRICDEHLPDDELRWWVCLNEGRLATSAGRYQQAFEHFGRIPAPAAGEQVSQALRGALMLQLGLLHKELTQFDEALHYCTGALEIRQSELGAGNLALVPHYLALGGLHVARHDAASLSRVVDTAAAICAPLASDHPDALAVRHLAAMVHYLRGEKGDTEGRKQARELWRQLLAECQGQDQRALKARLLHYLSRLDYLDWSADAKARGEALASLGREDFRQYQSQFDHWQKQADEYSAQLAQHKGSRQQYIKKLEQYDRQAGDEYALRQRAYQELKQLHDTLEREQSKLTELGDSLEKEKGQLAGRRRELVALSAGKKNGERTASEETLARGQKLAEEAIALLAQLEKYPSLHYAALCNYALILHALSQGSDPGDTHLDRAIDVLASAVALVESPRATVAGDVARAEFFAQYQSAFDLLVQFNVQKGRLAQAMIAAEQSRSRTLLDQLRAADVQSASSRQEDVAAVVEKWRTSREPLLYYYVGGATSFLFMLGGEESRIDVARLKLPVDADNSGTNRDASAVAVAALVTQLRATLSDASNSRSLGEQSLERKRLAASSTVLLPAVARDFLRAQKTRRVGHVTVVPHGAIAQLPLEALVLDEGSESLYLVDLCPPLAYAPSLAVLEDLGRRHSEVAGSLSVLSLGNPAYATGGKPPVDLAAYDSQDSLAAGGTTLRRQNEPLDLLVNSQEECRRVDKAFQSRFGEQSATVLTEHNATEGQLRQALDARSFTVLHLAAHGIIGDDHGGLFGRIMLAPPEKPAGSRRDDGILELAEIYDLNLGGCELAILSACNSARTKTSRRVASGDPSFSLASAFLARGARRVLATEWSVADESTSELVATFVEKLTAQLAAGQEVDYAGLLAAARDDVRKKNRQWDTPFHWAPFILIGPATGAPRPVQ